MYFEFPRAIPYSLKILFLQLSVFYFMNEMSSLRIIQYYYSLHYLLQAPPFPQCALTGTQFFLLVPFLRNKYWDIISYSRLCVLDWVPREIDSVQQVYCGFSWDQYLRERGRNWIGEWFKLVIMQSYGNLWGWDDSSEIYQIDLFTSHLQVIGFGLLPGKGCDLGQSNPRCLRAIL